MISASVSETDVSQRFDAGSPHLPWDHPFYDIARHQIIEVAGDDNFGRKVIVFNACRMPPQHQLDHHKLLLYLKGTLDQYVESDYTVIYFHHGLTSENKLPLGWFVDAYREFDRKALISSLCFQVQEEHQGLVYRPSNHVHQDSAVPLETNHQVCSYSWNWRPVTFIHLVLFCSEVC
uniref:CRAL-TRIO domain-containing protein n=1 Tax=Nothobranchius furzeri TaxID=105023 RepID=A0A8C6LNY6_NOTFU